MFVRLQRRSVGRRWCDEVLVEPPLGRIGEKDLVAPAIAAQRNRALELRKFDCHQIVFVYV